MRPATYAITISAPEGSVSAARRCARDATAAMPILISTSAISVAAP